MSPQLLRPLLLAALLLPTAQGVEILLSQGDVTEKQILQDDTTYTLTENIVIQDIHSLDDQGGGVLISSSNLIFRGNGVYNLKISNCSSTGLGWDLSDQNHPDEGGGAFFGDNITFQNMGEIEFINCASLNEKQDTYRLGRMGAAVTARNSLTFRNVKKITATDNHTGGTKVAQAYGGAFFARKTMIFDHVEDLHFSRNYTEATFWVGSGYPQRNHGGALYSEGMDPLGGWLPIGEYAVYFTNIAGSMTFTGNKADGDYEGYGGAIYAGGGGFMGIKSGGGILFSQIKGDILFNGNIAASLGGAIYSAVDVIFQNTGNISFTDNFAMGRYHNSNGGAIFGGYGNVCFSSIKGNILFSGNKSLQGVAGAVSSGYGMLFKDIEGTITFTNNFAEQAGALTVQTNGDLVFIHTGDVLFQNNSAETYGGAIYLSYGKNHIFSADNGNITFRGNTEKRGKTHIHLNSISFSNNSLAATDFRAQKNREISFFDPFNSGGEKTIFHYNRTEGMDTEPYNSTAPDFSGIIRFSGEAADQLIIRDVAGGETESEWLARLDSSKHTNVAGQSTIHGGTFILEKGVTYGNRNLSLNSGFNHRAGYLQMTTGSSINAKNTVFSGRDAILRADNTTSLNADHIDMSHGFSFDFLPFLNEHNSGLTLTANTLSLGGILGVADKNLDYYTDNRWAQRHVLLVLDTTKVNSTSGDLSGIASNLTGGAVIDSPYAYNGTWTYEWKDDNNDGINDQLYAIWTPLGNIPDPDPNPPIGPEPPVDPVIPGIKDVAPELAGEMIPNSLWSSLSNLNALGTAALGQLGIQRFHLPKDSNYWASGLGDFSRHNSVGRKDGYDYNGGGYAIGADTRICPNLVGGLAFGNLFGTNKSRNYNAQIKQESYAGMFYSAGYKELDSQNLLILQGQASYGYTENKLTTAYNDGDSSRGNWVNNTFFLSLQGSWDHSLKDNWILSPFTGVEYSDASQGTFTETGDKARHFGQGHLRNLSLPVGISLSKLSRGTNGMIWFNNLSASYVPDVYRDNPEADAQRLSNGFQWTAAGVSPARNAIRINWETRLLLNEKTSIFAGYSLEGRHHSFYQRVNAGVSTTF